MSVHWPPYTGFDALFTGFRLTDRIKTGRLICLLIAMAGTQWALAAEISVSVVGNDGEPVPEIVVFVEEMGAATDPHYEPKLAVMDQRDVRFEPHILVVEKGTLVEFPNSDVVAHHVYSFSRPNEFVLPLYKGTPPEPIAMQHDGVVTLGCNIHDGMLGYIVVVDTGAFGMTNEAGRASVSVSDSAGGYKVSIWSPRIRDAKGPIVQKYSALPDDEVIFHLQKTLRSAHVDQSDALEWEEY
jgi:plastocyanin